MRLRVCSLSCLVYKAHAPYYAIICVLFVCSIFLHIAPINVTIFEKMLHNLICVLWFCRQLLSEIFLVLRGIQRNIIIIIRNSLYNVSLLLVRFCGNLNFLGRFPKNFRIPDVMKKSRVETELFQTNVQTDRHHKANSRFSQFCEKRLRTICIIENEDFFAPLKTWHHF